MVKISIPISIHLLKFLIVFSHLYPESRSQTKHPDKNRIFDDFQLNTYIKKIITSPKEEKHIYKILIQNNEIPSCHTKWNSIFFNLEW